jgi:uncharacterized protein (TIGR03118 family)
MHRESTSHRKGLVFLTVLILSLVMILSVADAADPRFSLTNLVSDLPGAKVTDPNLVNPWGISYSATGPFWVSNNGTGTSTIYTVNSSNTVTKSALVVAIPGMGNVTGQAFNAGTGFNSDRFLFASEDGTISGWRGALGTTAEVLQLGSSYNVYKGLAIADVSGHSYLYEANFRTGAIDVLKGDALAPDLAGNFSDPNLPSGFAPFNIQNLNGNLYVTYAKQDATGTDDEAGAGNGFVDKFDTNGVLLGRLVSNGPLNSPWGLALAPSSFGTLAGDLLVGNFGDGTINAFDPSTGAYLGTLTNTTGATLTIDGLWGLIVGNNGTGGNSNTLYFTAGLNDEANGLFGSLVVPVPGTLLLLGTGLLGILAVIRRNSSN